MKSSRILDWLERLELFLYRCASAVVPVTNAFRDNLMRRGIDGDKIHVVTNGVDTTRFEPKPKDPDLLQKLGLQDKFVAGYVGTHGMAHGLHTLIDAAILLRNDMDYADVRIIMLGDGANRAELLDRAVAEHVTNMLFLDSVPKDEVVRYWSLLDVSIIHLKKSKLFTTVIPSKMFECMGMRIPILHGVEGESAEIVLRHDIGLIFPPDDAPALVAGLKRLHDDPALRNRLADNGPSAALVYDRRILAKDMLDVLALYARKR